MVLSDAEKVVIDQALHSFVDKVLPDTISAEEARLPESIKGMLTAITAMVEPMILAKIDAAIEAKFGPTAPAGV